MKDGTVLCEYRLSSQFFAQANRKLLTFVLPVMLLTVGGGIWLVWNSDESVVMQLGVASAVIAFVLIMFWVNLSKKKKIWATYRLVVGDDSITRMQDGLEDVTIAFSEITSISEKPDYGLIIEATSPPRLIGAPKLLEGYAEFNTNLAERHSFEVSSPKQSKWPQFSIFLMSVIVVGGFALVFAVKNPYISTVAGVIMLGVAAVVFLKLPPKEQWPKELQKVRFFLLLPVLSIVLRVVFDIIAILGVD